MKQREFKLGDICVAYNDPTFTAKDESFKYNGEECTVVEVMRNFTSMQFGEGSAEIVPLCYRVQFFDEALLVAKPHELRLKDDDDWVKQKVADLLFPMPVEFVGTAEEEWTADFPR
jgi:hypothetical protein